MTATFKSRMNSKIHKLIPVLFSKPFHKSPCLLLIQDSIAQIKLLKREFIRKVLNLTPLQPQLMVV